MDDQIKLKPLRVEGTKSMMPIANLECPFLDSFILYNQSLQENLEDQKKKGFLNSNLVKVVLEENERVFAIMDEEIKKEQEDFEKSPHLKNLDLSEDSYIYISYDEPPSPIGGFKAIRDGLVYPEFAYKKGIEGKVIVNCLTNEDGQVVKTNILRSVHPILDLVAINALKKVAWKPARQRDKPLTVWVAIPISFQIEEFEEYKSVSLLNMAFDSHEKTFLIQESNNGFLFLEKGFRRELARNMKIYSTEFYEFFYKHPMLIKYPYYLLHKYVETKGIGLVVGHSKEDHIYIE